MLGLSLACVAILCNVMAQLAIKLAGNSLLGQPLTDYLFSPMLLLAVMLYGTSFILTIKVYALNDLSAAAPFMAGGSFVLVAIVSTLFLSEVITVFRVIGMGLIIAGLLFLSH